MPWKLLLPPNHGSYVQCIKWAACLERSEALDKDIQWFRETLKMEVPEAKEQVKTMLIFSITWRKSHRLVLCHFYNAYFAHSAVQDDWKKGF